MPRGIGARIVSLVVSHLDALAGRSSIGIRWLTPAALLPKAQRHVYPDGFFNVGLAHGTSGVIAFLAAARATGVCRVDELLEGAVRLLLSTRRMEHGDHTFPDFVTRGTAHSSSPAWCHGDLGIAGALALAGEICEREDWSQLASQTALSSLERAKSVDACLCHGSVGFALLARRFYDRTRDQRFRDHLVNFLEVTLSYRNRDAVPFGFRSARVGEGPSKFTWVDYDLGLLFGVTGIGLGLLGCVSEGEPSWDRLLLLSA